MSDGTGTTGSGQKPLPIDALEGRTITALRLLSNVSDELRSFHRVVIEVDGLETFCLEHGDDLRLEPVDTETRSTAFRREVLDAGSGHPLAPLIGEEIVRVMTIESSTPDDNSRQRRSRGSLLYTSAHVAVLHNATTGQILPAVPHANLVPETEYFTPRPPQLPALVGRTVAAVTVQWFGRVDEDEPKHAVGLVLELDGGDFYEFKTGPRFALVPTDPPVDEASGERGCRFTYGPVSSDHAAHPLVGATIRSVTAIDVHDQLAGIVLSDGEHSCLVADLGDTIFVSSGDHPFRADTVNLRAHE